MNNLKITSISSSICNKIEQENENIVFSALAIDAANKALKECNIKNDEIDLLISITETSDYLCPLAGGYLREKLFLKKADYINLNCGLGGIVQGLLTASQFFSDNEYKTALILSGEVITPFLIEGHWTHEHFCNGTSAIIIKKDTENNSGILAHHIITDGKYYDLLQIQCGGTSCIPTEDRIRNNQHKLKEYGSYDLNKLVQSKFEEGLNACLQKSGLTKNNIDYFVINNMFPDSYNTQVNLLGGISEIGDKIAPQFKPFGFTADTAQQIDYGIKNKQIVRGSKVFIFEMELGIQSCSMILTY